MRLARMLGTLTLVSAPLALLAVACNSPEEGEAAPSPYAKESGFCDALAKAICNTTVVKACYGSADDASVSADKKTCISVASRSATCNPGNMDYDSSGAEACVASAKAMYADASLSKAELDAHDEACAVVLNRGGGNGSSCNFDNDCDAGAGLSCVVTPSDPGSCRDPLEVAPGGACDEAGAVCDEDHYCNVEAGSFCVVRPDANSPCSDVIPCQQDAHCVADLCLIKDANGSPCTMDDECTGGFCIKPPGEPTGDCSGVIQLHQTSAACDALK